MLLAESDFHEGHPRRHFPAVDAPAGWAKARLRKAWPLFALLAAGLLSGCVSGPARDGGGPAGPGASASLPRAGLGSEIALRAMAQIGTAYRYGGADLDGFDCSGLVYFIHEQLGLTAPRTAHQQFAAATPVSKRELAPGDLVFFRFAGSRISHVGIYAGEGRFVHAPQSGRTIEIKQLDDGYYARHFAGAGRLYGG